MENSSHEKTLLLVSHLRRNARETLTNLSKTTNIPISTIFEKVREYIKTTAIKRYTALIDFQNFGYSTLAKIAIKVKKQHKAEAREFFLTHKRVNSAYCINNGFDFLIEGVFKNMKELEDFLESVEAKFPIEKKQVFYVIEELKKEDFLSNPEYLKMTNFEV